MPDHAPTILEPQWYLNEELEVDVENVFGPFKIMAMNKYMSNMGVLDMLHYLHFPVVQREELVKNKI
ncbi:MAG: hypothetical protein EZS28_005402 [Streblomastix strix]|uniref:Uncharacterized protein n=1 Tax=Streblomastix strix TaxID=222440 RepID=A0A5J4WXW3_9EUKA|nr:MAG: hypothetical protein EZS28_005402 [Streblomastix strix]